MQPERSHAHTLVQAAIVPPTCHTSQGEQGSAWFASCLLVVLPPPASSYMVGLHRSLCCCCCCDCVDDGWQINRLEHVAQDRFVDPDVKVGKLHVDEHWEARRQYL
jgi:hypothetical protein